MRPPPHQRRYRMNPNYADVVEKRPGQALGRRVHLPHGSRHMAIANCRGTQEKWEAPYLHRLSEAERPDDQGPLPLALYGHHP